MSLAVSLQRTRPKASGNCELARHVQGDNGTLQHTALCAWVSAGLTAWSPDQRQTLPSIFPPKESAFPGPGSGEAGTAPSFPIRVAPCSPVVSTSLVPGKSESTLEWESSQRLPLGRKSSETNQGRGRCKLQPS